jgi:hypothetical protein
VRAGPGGRHAVRLTRGQVRGAREAGDVRRPRRCDRGLLAADVIRDAADAIAESWLRIDSSSVSSTTASAKLASTVINGE